MVFQGAPIGTVSVVVAVIAVETQNINNIIAGVTGIIGSDIFEIAGGIADKHIVKTLSSHIFYRKSKKGFVLLVSTSSASPPKPMVIGFVKGSENKRNRVSAGIF